MTAQHLSRISFYALEHARLTWTLKEYELAEEEVKISLDRFRDEYCNPDGSIK